ncbi:hypothetical protein AGMMS49949_07720 [Alphaproteobacteria bacterium]|nr:hypothetical protein AGMMS49949_07720 [Alphaproteobacteria bacterium]GHS96783.1 hypothetical protein AGMMS50296_3230 [Alphaproteobacteria bacterium]
MTQRDLGKILGITAQQVQKYEVGTNALHVNWLFDFDQALNCSLEHFLLSMCQAQQSLSKQLREEVEAFKHIDPSSEPNITLEELEKFIMQFLALKYETQKNVMALVDEFSPTGTKGNSRKKTKSSASPGQEDFKSDKS